MTILNWFLIIWLVPILFPYLLLPLAFIYLWLEEVEQWLQRRFKDEDEDLYY